MRVITDEKGVLGPRELGAADVQEKMGGVARSQAQGTEQVRFPGRPDTRVPEMRMAGVWVRAGERRGETGDQEEGLGCGPREASGFGPASPPGLPLYPRRPPRRGSHPSPALEPSLRPLLDLPPQPALPVTCKESWLDI